MSKKRTNNKKKARKGKRERSLAAAKKSLVGTEPQNQQKKNPLALLFYMKEVTPPTYNCFDELVDFINIYLKPACEPRLVTPDPPFSARRYHSGSNVLCALHMPRYHDKYEPVFGFIVFVDMKTKFIRANAHVWLVHKETDEWIDPTPLTDEEEELGKQMLVRSDFLFTKEERKLYLTNPDFYNPGAILSHMIVPKEYQDLLVLEHQYVKVPVEEHRLQQVNAHAMANMFSLS